MRFFAAAEVVVFHASYGLNAWPHPRTILQGLASGGYAAVSFFFVLSGFILFLAYTPSTANPGKQISAWAFWRRRFARILPVYLLGLLLALPFLIAAFVRQGVSSSDGVGMVLVLFLLQAWWPSYALYWNAPSWSLSIEAFFYVLFPWLRRGIDGIPAGVLCVAAYALLLLTTILRRDALSLADLGDYTPTIAFEYYFPLLHLPQFIFGMVLGWAWLRHRQVFAGRLPSFMLAAGAIGVVLIFGLMPWLPWWTRSEAVLAPMFGLIIFSAPEIRALPLLRSPFLVLLGEASYSLYILHAPLLKWWQKAFHLSVDGSIAERIWLTGFFFVVVTVISIASYRWIERPLRQQLAGSRT